MLCCGRRSCRLKTRRSSKEPVSSIQGGWLITLYSRTPEPEMDERDFSRRRSTARLLWPFRLHEKEARDADHSHHHALFVVRRSGRKSGCVLSRHFQERRNRQDLALRLRRLRDSRPVGSVMTVEFTSTAYASPHSTAGRHSASTKRSRSRCSARPGKKSTSTGTGFPREATRQPSSAVAGC